MRNATFLAFAKTWTKSGRYDTLSDHVKRRADNSHNREAVGMERITRNMRSARQDIQEMVDRETKAWDTQDVELLLSIFHPDIVWPWPPTNADHDPMNWVMVLGKFDHQRWGAFYQRFFQEHKLVHNKRETIKIEISDKGNGAFAVADIDTLWVDTKGHENHWQGRVCKVYAKVSVLTR